MKYMSLENVRGGTWPRLTAKKRGFMACAFLSIICGAASLAFCRMWLWPTFYPGQGLIERGDILQRDVLPFRNTSLSWDARLQDLMSRLTLEEKLQQMAHGGAGPNGPAPPIPRLGISPYQWGTECLSGDVQAGFSTAFPMPIGMGASFDSDLVLEAARATGTEVRAKNNDAVNRGVFSFHLGLSCWSPVLNVMRHPLWGRNQETYGLQGNHSRYLLANAGCKHFAAHNGPENMPISRLSFDAQVPETDLLGTYLWPFEKCVEAGSMSIMCSYNRINGVPACANYATLNKYLRHRLGFQGYVVSDEHALEFIVSEHKYARNYLESAALAANAGCDLEDGDSYDDNVFDQLPGGVAIGKVSLRSIDRAVKGLFRTRFLLGEFDPPASNPYKALSMDIIQSESHRSLSQKAAVKSFVMLKNNGVLPLNEFGKEKLAIIGPFANTTELVFGDYAPSLDSVTKYTATPWEVLANAVSSSGGHATYAGGCTDGPHCTSVEYSQVEEALRGSTVAIVFLGLSISYESEGNDRSSMCLPGQQAHLLEMVAANAKASNKATILVLFNAGPVDLTFAMRNVDAIIECFYPGQSVGMALKEVLFGNESPAGRLPFTWPKFAHLSGMTDYSFQNATYRYNQTNVALPFGYGFEYSDLTPENPQVEACEKLKVCVKVTNTGNFSSDEVVQVYLAPVDRHDGQPQIQLVAFKRQHIRMGEKAQVCLEIAPEDRSWAWQKKDAVAHLDHTALLGTPLSTHANLTEQLCVQQCSCSTECVGATYLNQECIEYSFVEGERVTAGASSVVFDRVQRACVNSEFQMYIGGRQPWMKHDPSESNTLMTTVRVRGVPKLLYHCTGTSSK